MRNTFKVMAATAVATGLAFATFAADAPADVPTAKTVLATVNGTDITLGNIISLRERLPKQYKKLPDDILLKGMVGQLIQQTVLMDTMKKQMTLRVKLGAENENRSFLAAEMLARMSKYKVPEADIKAAYDKKYAAAAPEKEYNASHILVKTKKEAEAIIKLLSDGADFATVARDKSTGPSGPSGGELGWFSAGAMVPKFEAAVSKLAVGQISPPVQTQFGWHVVRLNNMRNKAIPTLEKERAALTAKLEQKHVEDEVTRMVAAANVVRSDVVVDPALIRDMSLLDK